MRESVSIVRVTSWTSVRDQSGVLDLVSQVQYGEPYNYRPDDSPAPEDWFPALVDSSEITLVAYGSTQRAVGYCVALGLTQYPDALAVADALGVQPSTTGYLAELGVCVRSRRRGIATQLVGRLLADPPDGVTAWAVRTLEHNTPAFALYQSYGFEFAPAAAQIRHGRPRVYLVRRTSGIPARDVPERGNSGWATRPGARAASPQP